jgi:hypothetical protein
MMYRRSFTAASDFGLERNAIRVFLDTFVVDRYALVKGMQLVRDELQLAYNK